MEAILWSEKLECELATNWCKEWFEEGVSMFGAMMIEMWNIWPRKFIKTAFDKKK